MFAIYLEPLINEIISSHFGCHVGSQPANVFAYADDIAILAPSIASLNKLIKICEKYSIEYQLEFNPAKSSVMIFRSTNDVTTTYDPLDIKMNNIKIKTCDYEKYLGFNIKPSKNIFEFKNIINDMKVKTNVILTSL